MTVKEYIEYLKTLDQDANIWVVYDTYDWFEPKPDDRVNARNAEWCGKHRPVLEVKEGDYIITAG